MEESAGKEEEKRQRKATKASRGVARGEVKGKVLVERLLVERGRCEGTLTKQTHHKYHSLTTLL